uniref:Uncharacterized protein n=1 Tax=Anguilla anguilla TaxID=7936 RepID=A0A0E9V9M9_ANGAN
MRQVCQFFFGTFIRAPFNSQNLSFDYSNDIAK